MGGVVSGRAVDRIPSLDGLRAVSISFVVLAHLAGTRNFLAKETVLYPLGDIGELGVRVFFVISGYLITTLLFQQLATHGHISLCAFYFRRTIRIFPAFYAFVGVLAFIRWAGTLTLAPRDLLHALTYTTNYYQERSWYFGHLWSLAVEEQFYLCWPLALILLGRRAALAGAASVLLLSPLARVATWAFFPSHRAGIGVEFHTVADALASGCLLAGLRDWLWSHEWYGRLLSSRMFFIVPVVVWLMARQPFVLVTWLLGNTLVNIGIVLIVDRSIRIPSDAIGRFLNLRPMVFLGALSYSLYLWQQPFLNRAGSALFTAFPWNLCLALAAATLSYYAIERPFLRLRRSLEARWRVVSHSRVASGAQGTSALGQSKGVLDEPGTGSPART